MLYRLTAVGGGSSDALRKEFFTDIRDGKFREACAKIPAGTDAACPFLLDRSPTQKNLFHWLVKFLEKRKQPTIWISSQIRDTQSDFYKFLVIGRMVVNPLISCPDSDGEIPEQQLKRVSPSGAKQIFEVLRIEFGTKKSNATVTSPLRHSLLWDALVQMEPHPLPLEEVLIIGAGRCSDVPVVSGVGKLTNLVSFERGDVHYSPECYELASIYPSINHLDVIDADKENLECLTTQPPDYAHLFSRILKDRVAVGMAHVRESGMPTGERWHKKLRWGENGISLDIDLCRNSHYDMIVACHVLTYPFEEWVNSTVGYWSDREGLISSSRRTVWALLDKLKVGGKLIVDYISCETMSCAQIHGIAAIRKFFHTLGYSSVVHIAAISSDVGPTDPPQYIILTKL